MPWNAEGKVRAISGVGQAKVISDDDINLLILQAYKEAKEQVYDFHCKERPKQCWSSCSGYNYCINGSNTTFFINPDVGDHDGDGLVTGYGEQSCGTDVDGYYRDCNGMMKQVRITVDSAANGRLTVTRQGGSAIPSTAKGLYISYYTEACNYSESLFRDAVLYLASHKCILRFGELERASSADLAPSQNVKYVNPKRMYKYYRKIMRQISTVNIGGVY